MSGYRIFSTLFLAAAITVAGGAAAFAHGEDVLEMEVNLTQPDRDIAPLTVPLEQLGPGHYVAYDFTIPISGDWVLIANALVDDTTQVVVKGDIAIR